ncbi:hypothetical protein ACLBXM_11900 [Xanthobacteraceae bacterium A53D]
MLLAVPAAAAPLTFEAVRVQPADSRPAQCQNGIMEHRIAEWRRRDRPPETQAFASVQQIMEDVHPPALRALEAKGCEPHYLWSFLACSAVDWPEDAAPQIIPKGVSAPTEAAMAEVMQGCLAQLRQEGISPTKGLLDRTLDRLKGR